MATTSPPLLTSFRLPYVPPGIHVVKRMHHASSMRLLASGVQGDVYLSPSTQLAVVKVVHAPADGVNPALKPHNIVREARILQELPHDNVVRLLDYSYSMGAHYLTLEALPLALTEVLALSRPLPPPEKDEVFFHVARGVFAALAHLHSHSVAHRDVKPANILLGYMGVVKLIDLATAWDDGDGDDGIGGMVCQVGTGSYRGPEILFSPPAYDAPALDLWAAGATLAEFYRPSRAVSGSGSPVSSASTPPPNLEDELDPLEDDHLETSPDGKGDAPVPLFDATFGEIGLAGSIFRLMGTPTEQNWPSFARLPDSDTTRTMFEPRLPRPLSEAIEAPDTVLAVLESVLRLEPSWRVPAAAILRDLPEALGNSGSEVLREWAGERLRGLEKMRNEGQENGWEEGQGRH